MGYYAKGSGTIVIESESISNLCLKVRMMLNSKRALKSEIRKGRQKGWNYAWVDSDDLIEACRDKQIFKIFECWKLSLNKVENSDNLYNISYDDKLGDVEIFLKEIAPLVAGGFMDFVGEDNSMWRYEYKQGQFRVLEERILEDGNQCTVYSSG